MLVLIEPPTLGLSTTVLREDGAAQHWCYCCLLHLEMDYSLPTILLEPGTAVWVHVKDGKERYLSNASLRHFATGAPREHHGSHDGMTISPPTPFTLPDNA